ncbi:MAG: hypothetical protein V5B36_03340 [Candidatus Accumulibacter sp. UW25]|jgi:hypothetical protein
MTEHSLTQIFALLKNCSEEDRRHVFRMLRDEFPIHAIEQRFNAPAEIILEAIARSPDLTVRGIRGVIADAAFGQYVVPVMIECGWTDVTPPGNHSYDYKLQDDIGAVTVQVKMQRQKDQRPMLASEGYRSLSSDMYVVETQRTRGGKHPTSGEDTRPYRYGEFGILAVSMHPSTNCWEDFLYTVTDWLLPDGISNRILKFQPVSKVPNDDWTTDFEKVIRWWRSGQEKSIARSIPANLSLL